MGIPSKIDAAACLFPVPVAGGFRPRRTTNLTAAWRLRFLLLIGPGHRLVPTLPHDFRVDAGCS